MSDAQVARFNPNFKEQQKVKTQPKTNDGCVTADLLDKKLNVSKFNKMMGEAEKTINGFLSSYIQEQQGIKDSRQNRDLDLELDRYRQTAINEKRLLIDKNQEAMNELMRTFQMFKNAVLSTEHTRDLHKMLTNQNSKLLKEQENQQYNIEIADRKTYYENEQNSSARWISMFLKENYLYFILSLVIAIVLLKRYTDVKLLGIVVLLALYPYIIFYLLKMIYGLYNWLRSYTKWVYLDKNI